MYQSLMDSTEHVFIRNGWSLAENSNTVRIKAIKHSKNENKYKIKFFNFVEFSVFLLIIRTESSINKKWSTNDAFNMKPRYI